MTTVSKTVPGQSGDIQLAAQTYQQSMQNLTAVVAEKASESGVVILHPGQLKVVQVQAGKQYKLRKPGDANKTPDDLIAVRHGDALHVRYADGSVVHFEGFYSTCTDNSVCSVNLASDSASGVSLSADVVNSGPAADDGLLVYAHGNSDVLMSMAQDQAGLIAAMHSVATDTALTYFAPSPYLGMGAFALLAAGLSAAAPGATAAAGLTPDPTIAEQDNALKKINAAADANNASGTSSPVVAALTLDDYLKAKVNGVNDGNVAAINSALDTVSITANQTNTAAKLQTIVNDYAAILASADGKANTPATALTADVYNAIGVTGAGTAGSALSLLDSAVDLSQQSAVNTATKLQALADASAHVMTAAGLPAGATNPLTAADLTALGVTGLTASNTQAVIAAIVAQTSDDKVDTLAKLQAVATAAEIKVDTALSAIAAAAKANTATSGKLDAATYTAAGVTGVNDAATLAAVNSALDSAAITDAQADTTAEVQKIVDAYKAILGSADGSATPNTAVALTGDQFTAVGVTGAPTSGNALALLGNVVDTSATAAVDTTGELQDMVNAAKIVAAATGQGMGTTVTAVELGSLGITGNISATTIAAIEAAIGLATPGTLNTKAALQNLVDTATSTAALSAALTKLQTAATGNTAANLTSVDYAKAGITGVTDGATGNIAAINSALNSNPVTGTQLGTEALAQGVVDAYKAILTSADGTAANTTTPLTGAQYTAIGVTGVSGVSAEGNALRLLDDVVDGKPTTGVDTVTEVQALADAAAHVLAAAGGTPAEIAALTLVDFQALGITGVTVDNLPAVLAAIAAATDLGVDTKTELQNVAALAASKAVTALNAISAAAEANSATATSPAATVYAEAGVTGVTAANLGAINSALNSSPVNGIAADTSVEVQAIVNAYQAILNSADGSATPNTTTSLTGAQYTAIGVTGVSGVSAEGNALHLLDDVVDGKPTTGVDTAPEVQALADAANHVLAAAAGTPSQAAVVTQSDLLALGVTGVTSANLASIQAAISGSADNGTGVDTQVELLALANGAINAHPSITSALSGVLNLDVTSNLVFSASQTVTVGTGFIHITDLGGSTSSGGTGYQGDTTTNSQTIDVATAVASGFLTITGTGASTKIIINPKWDLDLSSNYQISIDDTAFLDANGSNNAVHFAPISFSTVAPGTHSTGTVVTEATASQAMSDSTGALMVSKSWLDIQGIGAINGGMTQLGDLSGGQFALVMKNYATTPGGASGDKTDGISTHDTNIGVQNFGANDIVYFDSQVNNLSQQLFDAHYTQMTNGANIGGLTGQNTLVMGLVSTPRQQGSTAMISLGLEGNTANTIYPAVYTLDASTAGWADAWHNASAPLIMG